MALEINAQYTRFVQFAQEQVRAGNEEAIARGAGDPAGREIRAADNDYVHKWLRGANERNANNRSRELFREAIRNMFGGNEANIPQNVKDAMKLADYDGDGHPLTARRIMFVKAEVDRIISNATAVNDAIVANINNKTLDQLPQNIQDALAEIVDDLRETFGADHVPPGRKITDILRPQHVTTRLNALAASASAQGRNAQSGAGYHDLVHDRGRAGVERAGGQCGGRLRCTRRTARPGARRCLQRRGCARPAYERKEPLEGRVYFLEIRGVTSPD